MKIRGMLFVSVAMALTLPTLTLGASAGVAQTPPAATTQGYQLFFGDLHAHTNYSDGKGTPWRAFREAREAGADFFATTDHVHYPYGPTGLTTELWADTLEAAETLTQDGEFVAIPGYELWLPETGELNVFDAEEIYLEDGNPAGHGFDNGLHVNIREALRNLYDWLAETGAIGQWNHPWLFGNGSSTTPLEEFFNFGFRTAARDRGIAVVEAYNNGSYANAYVRALDAGWHVLPAANSDTHSADWIAGSEVRTVLLAEQLTADDLYDAMRASRGYATRDRNLQIRYTLDGAVMGSELSPAPIYDLTVDISDPDGATDAITRIDVISDGGKVVAHKNVNAADVQWSTTLASEDESYFFVRVTTRSGAGGEPRVTAWTAPVWTGR
jgi:hypothetical protein